ncbi:hypothetical protein Dd1591_3305 [Dickeya chrysanthemi Ech1591]|uniref:Uncharacterized protein n=1 Tax=Dickeya chrysanthemi (strain Ech1591) TaxID=561229 RepID=C6CIM5_DICC1|nr:hypothetical protein [Dickeya chrysanthemi]ACT08123.1 hypothetical protein Dd1591_3305 [Dickeya chrysanthemi Ech1591]
MMILKKRLLNLLCLPIVISLVSVNPCYALTQAQWNSMILGLVAGGAWAGWGTLNAVLAYIDRGGGPLTIADGANIFGTICGASAASVFRSWSPPTDTISAANLILAATKAGAVVASSTTCHWVGNSFLKLYFEIEQEQANKIRGYNRLVLDSRVRSIEMHKNILADKIVAAATSERNANELASRYKAQCPYGPRTTTRCYRVATILDNLQRQAEADKLVARQAAWDVAEAEVELAKLEGNWINNRYNTIPHRP